MYGEFDGEKFIIKYLTLTCFIIGLLFNNKNK
jgi:hypothetical protein